MLLGYAMDGEAADAVMAKVAREQKRFPDFWRYVLAAGFGAGSAWTTMLINQRVNQAEHAAFTQLIQVHEDRMGRIQTKLEAAAADENELRGEVRQLEKQVERCVVKP